MRTGDKATTILALVAGLVVMATKRVDRRVQAGQTV
jgi:hypothetical protein